MTDRAGAPFLEVRNLHKNFEISAFGFGKKNPILKALQDISFTLTRGETLGVVGESGCGKSTLARCLVRLLDPSAGEIFISGENILTLKGRDLKALRKKIQIVFQDPSSSLNPRMTVYELLEEPLIVHHLAGNREERKARVHELVSMVGLRKEYLDRYPHEFSGGQKQRIGIARALAVQPEILICDEPVSALDVSVQAQILNLLRELQQKLGLTMIFIAHDLKVVEHISDRVAVLYLGRLMEIGKADEIYKNSRHPYTRALLNAVPIPDPALARNRTVLGGELPSPLNPPSGCVFRTRCPLAGEACANILPPGVTFTATHVSHCLKTNLLDRPVLTTYVNQSNCG